MKNHAKKALAWLLALMLIVSSMPLSALANEGNDKVNNVQIPDEYSAIQYFLINSTETPIFPDTINLTYEISGSTVSPLVTWEARDGEEFNPALVGTYIYDYVIDADEPDFELGTDTVIPYITIIVHDDADKEVAPLSDLDDEEVALLDANNKAADMEIEVGDYIITRTLPGQEPFVYDDAAGTVTITTNEALTIKRGPNTNGGYADETIILNSPTGTNITLVNMDLDTSRIDNKAAIEIAKGNTAVNKLYFTGSNLIQSGKNRAGIVLLAGSQLEIIEAENSPSYTRLNVNGGGLAAGIGGDSDYYQLDRSNAGQLTVTSGTLRIYGGEGNIDGIGGSGAAIGGGTPRTDLETTGNGGTYIQTGGSVYAYGGANAAGIGGGRTGDGGRVYIEGGYLEVYSGSRAAAIGGGYNGSGGVVNITGGEVIAQSTNQGGSNNSGTGIGAGYLSGYYANITGGETNISGGVVLALGGEDFNSAGIGDTTFSVNSTFSTEAKNSQGDAVRGTPIIFTNGISDKSDIYEWRGIITEKGKNSIINETAVAIDTDIKVYEDYTITVPEGNVLAINSGVTLENIGSIINNGKITIDGELVNDGSLINNGVIENSGSFINNGSIDTADKSITGNAITGNGDIITRSSYEITFVDMASLNGTATTDPAGYAEAGQVVTVIGDPDENYTINYFNVGYHDDGKQYISVDMNGTGNVQTFIMPAYEVIVQPVFKAGTSNYSILTPTVIGGKVTTTPSGTALSGEKVNVTTVADTGFATVGIGVRDLQGNSITVTGSGESYSFNMPNEAVTITPIFSRNYITVTRIDFPGPAAGDYNYYAEQFYDKNSAAIPPFPTNMELATNVGNRQVNVTWVPETIPYNMTVAGNYVYNMVPESNENFYYPPELTFPTITISVVDNTSTRPAGPYMVTANNHVEGWDSSLPNGGLPYNYDRENNMFYIYSNQAITLELNPQWQDGYHTPIVLSGPAGTNVTLKDIIVDCSERDNLAALSQYSTNIDAPNIIFFEGSVNLTGGKNAAGIASTSRYNLDIAATPGHEGTAILYAKGGEGGAGIGGNYHLNSSETPVTSSNSNGGNITIHSGTVHATGGKGAAGIGGGFTSFEHVDRPRANGGLYIQKGGTVYATGGQNAAGIGGGDTGDGGRVFIEGGYLEALGMGRAAGIGGGYDGNGGIVNITGGVVVAQCKPGGTAYNDGAGIGAGYDYYGIIKNSTGGIINIGGGSVLAIGGTDNGAPGIGDTAYTRGSTFSTIALNSNGQPVSGIPMIFTTSITDQSGRDEWDGLVTISGADTIFNDSAITLLDDATVFQGQTITVPRSKDFAIGNGITLHNNGNIVAYGDITNRGSIINNGIMEVYESVDGYISGSGTIIYYLNVTTFAELKAAISDGNLAVGLTANIVINENFTLPQYATLTIAEGSTLTVANGATLTLDANARIINQGMIQNNGEIANAGVIANSGTIAGNGAITGDGVVLTNGIDVSGGSAEVKTFAQLQAALNNSMVTSITLKSDLAINNGITLTIPSGKKLTVDTGVTLVINGILTNHGELITNGDVMKNGAINGSGSISGSGLLIDAAGNVTVKNVSSMNTAFANDNVRTVTLFDAESNTTIVVAQGSTLTIPQDKTLIIAEGMTLQNMANATIVNNGTIENYGLVWHSVQDLSNFSGIAIENKGSGIVIGHDDSVEVASYEQFKAVFNSKNYGQVKDIIIVGDVYIDDGISYTMNSNDSITVNSSTTFAIDNGSFTNFGNITINDSGTLAIDSDGALNNFGTLTVNSNGSLTNSGIFIDEGTFVGTVTGGDNQAEGAGSYHRVSDMTALSTALAPNSSTKNILIDSDLQLSGTLAIYHEVTLTIGQGVNVTCAADTAITVQSGGQIINHGNFNFTNAASFTVNADGVVENLSIMTNDPNKTLANSGIIYTAPYAEGQVEFNSATTPGSLYVTDGTVNIVAGASELSLIKALETTRITTINLSTNMAIPANTERTVRTEVTLNIQPGATLTVNGDLRNNGTINNRGIIAGEDKISGFSVIYHLTDADEIMINKFKTAIEQKNFSLDFADIRSEAEAKTAIENQLQALDSVDYTGIKLTVNQTGYMAASKTTAGSYTFTVEIEKNAKTMTTRPIMVVISNDGILSIEDAIVTLGEALIFNDEEQTQTIASVVLNGKLLKEGTDYTVTNNKGKEAKDDYELTITATENSNYTGMITRTFSIGKSPYEGSGNSRQINLLPQDISAFSLKSWQEIAGATFGEPVVSGTDGVFDPAPTITENEGINYLNISIAADAVLGTNATITIPVSGMTIYDDFNITITVNVQSRVPIGNPSYSSISSAGKTLADANLGLGNINVAGIIAWDLAENTIVQQNTAYAWTFTPTRPDLYDTLKGEITLWRRSSGSGNSAPAPESAPDEVESIQELISELPAKSDYENMSPEEVSSSYEQIEEIVNNINALSANDKDMLTDEQVLAVENAYRQLNQQLDPTRLTLIDIRNGVTLSTSLGEAGQNIAEGISLQVSPITDEDEVANLFSSIRDGENTPFALYAGEELLSAININLLLDNNTQMQDNIIGDTLMVRIYVPNSSSSLFTVCHQLPSGEWEYFENLTVDQAGIITVPVKTLSPFLVFAVDSTDAMNFSDVNATDWFYDAVKYVYDNDIMLGISATEFSPNGTGTRSMLWMVLARNAGIDTGVAEGEAWYEKARAWAIAEGISDGSNPNGYITRQEFVTMLYRDAGSPTQATNTLEHSDAANIADWALDAMAWGVAEGIIVGFEDNSLRPETTATRAEMATMLMRYII